MPINRGTSNKARNANVKQFMKDAKAGTSKHIKTKSQAIAAAFSEQEQARKRKRSKHK